MLFHPSSDHTGMNSQNFFEIDDRLRQRARQCIDSQHWDDAQTAMESLAQHVSSDTAVSLEIADGMFRSGQFRASTASMLRIATRLPRDAPLIVEVVQRLIGVGESVAARSCLDLLAQAPDPPPELLVAQSHLRFSLGEIAVAKELMERAMAAGVESPGELHLYAMLLQFSGEVERAAMVLESCLRRWPRFGDAAMVLVNLRKQKPEANQLEFVQEQLRQLPQNSEDPSAMFVSAEFEYAQFKILDDLQRYEEAWPALARCNALMHKLNPYDAAGEAAVTDALLRMPVSAGKAGARPAPACAGPIPIFIVGMPRSGTTLLDRMLSRHSEIVSAGEIIDFWRQLHWAADVTPAKSQGLLKIIQHSADIDYAELGVRYLKQTQWRAQGRACYIDKLPANVQMIAFIRRALPQAHILHMVREPMDVCFSNYRAMFGNVSAYSYDTDSVVHCYRQYQRVVKHWHTTLPGAMLDVSYADLVQQPEVTLRRVLAHCGLSMQDGCLHPERNKTPVATPSSIQVREPVHTRGIGQWRHYAAQLEPMRQAVVAQSALGTL